MIAAADLEAVRRGDFFFVLGEIDPAACTIDNALWIAQHPDPSDILRANEADIPEPRVLSVWSKAWPRATVRTSRAFESPKDYFFEARTEAAGESADRVLRVADLVVVRRGDGHLAVQTEDGRVGWENLDFLGDSLSGFVHMSGFRVLPANAARSPRLTIDRLVVSRESWVFPATEVPVGGEKTEAEQFLSVRRWAARAGLPRFVFVRSPLEVKPFYVDFESPVLTGVLARVVRRANEHEPGPVLLGVEEMLPGVEDTWLPDATGQRYTSELRLVAVDLSSPT